MCALPWVCLDQLRFWWFHPGRLQPSLAWRDPKLCPEGPCIIQRQLSLLGTIWESSGYHLAPTEWFLWCTSRAASQSRCILEWFPSWRNQIPCLKYISRWVQKSCLMPLVRLHRWCCYGFPQWRTRSILGLGQLGSYWVVGRPQLSVHFLPWLIWWAVLA